MRKAENAKEYRNHPGNGEQFRPWAGLRCRRGQIRSSLDAILPRGPVGRLGGCRGPAASIPAGLGGDVMAREGGSGNEEGVEVKQQPDQREHKDQSRRDVGAEHADRQMQKQYPDKKREKTGHNKADVADQPAQPLAHPGEASVEDAGDEEPEAEDGAEGEKSVVGGAGDRIGIADRDGHEIEPDREKAGKECRHRQVLREVG